MADIRRFAERPENENAGSILAQVRSNSAPFATLVADVPTAHVETLYLLLGNWFAWLVLALLLLSVAQLVLLRKKPLAWLISRGDAAKNSRLSPVAAMPHSRIGRKLRYSPGMSL